MNDGTRTVQMYLVDPGNAGPDGDFNFELQARANAGRTVQFALAPVDAHQLHKALGEYLKVQR